MKKSLSFLVLIMCISLAANAQFFAGGSMSFTTNGGKIETSGISTEKQSEIEFSFSPMGGLFLSDKLMVGAIIGGGFNKTTNPGTPEVSLLNTYFNFTPFARYYAFKFNKFNFFAQGNFGYSRANQSTTTGTVTVDGTKTNSYGIYAFPGVSYDLLEWLSLEATINGFSIGAFSRTSSLNDVKNTTNTIQFGVNTNNIVTSGAISIGAIVKF